MSQRNCSLDCLRVLAMFFVLLVHSLGVIGVPSLIVFENSIFQAIGTSVLYFVSIGSVNLFVLLSGWFGLNFTLKKMASLFFQIIFWNIISVIVYLFFGGKIIDILWLDVFALSGSLWFFISYLCLLIFSPVLNCFIENSSRCLILNVIVFFFLFQTIWGWIIEGASFFMHGYSPLSFIGLYLLARFVRNYPVKYFTYKYCYDIMMYAFLGVITVAVVMFFANYGIYASRMFSYISPIIILSCLYLLLFFSKIKLNVCKKTIKYLATSSFAVYIFHCNILIHPFYVKIINGLYKNELWILILVFMVVLFFMVVVVDKIRLYLWNLLILRVQRGYKLN